MNIMVIGGGGREHAVIRKIKENPLAAKIYARPGNGGIARDAECVNISATDIPSQVQFALTHEVDFAVVTPDDPLVLGAVDALEEAGIPCFGPGRDAAIIGDRMDTDIIAGIENEMDTVLVLSGVSTAETVSEFAYRPKYVLENVGKIAD